ncbi:NACHT nucleoside triphosphatase [Penicillium argentinense]|uniref:NACHT nucleoside triphosphatase n=1 Tax=Penicillium argentinense TaxID=1131581 RepID=A0A9W9EJ97_9EURO|nr:NACHT nucleoside triphosphatase [Penicillium argentinense]KAJ5082878.1 NACHT nucleoside triphosphatase [Penicillium argentinense]
MADRASITSRIAVLLSSGNEMTESIRNMDVIKTSAEAIVLQDLQNLLGVLRSLEVAIQARDGLSHITPDTLQALDDAVMRCERSTFSNLQSEKRGHQESHQN